MTAERATLFEGYKLERRPEGEDAYVVYDVHGPRGAHYQLVRYWKEPNKLFCMNTKHPNAGRVVQLRGHSCFRETDDGRLEALPGGLR